MAAFVRGQWGIENGLHRVLDVVSREDDSRARAGHAGANVAVVRRVAVALRSRPPAREPPRRFAQVHTADLNAHPSHRDERMRLLDELWQNREQFDEISGQGRFGYPTRLHTAFNLG